MLREADFYTPGEAANMLRLTEFTVLGLLTSGQLEGHQDDQGRWWIPAATVDEAVRRDRDADERELEATRARGEALHRLERDRDALMESYAGMVREALEDLAPEERHRIYKLLRLGVRFRPEWPLEITGIFSEVGEEAECDLSSCKPSSLGV